MWPGPRARRREPPSHPLRKARAPGRAFSAPAPRRCRCLRYTHIESLRPSLPKGKVVWERRAVGLCPPTPIKAPLARLTGSPVDGRPDGRARGGHRAGPGGAGRSRCSQSLSPQPHSRNTPESRPYCENLPPLSCAGLSAGDKPARMASSCGQRGPIGLPPKTGAIMHCQDFRSIGVA